MGRPPPDLIQRGRWHTPATAAPQPARPGPHRLHPPGHPHAARTGKWQRPPGAAVPASARRPPENSRSDQRRAREKPSPDCRGRRCIKDPLGGSGPPIVYNRRFRERYGFRAAVAESVDAPGLGPGAERREGSSPFGRTRTGITPPVGSACAIPVSIFGHRAGARAPNPGNPEPVRQQCRLPVSDRKRELSTWPLNLNRPARSNVA